MKIIPIKTRIIKPPKDNIYDLLDNLILQEWDIIFITSKILAIHQWRCFKIDEIENKQELVKKEVDLFIKWQKYNNYDVDLTIKNNTLIPNSWIDESNSNWYYVLWPKKTELEAEEICKYLKNKFSIKKLAVVITDSYTTPMRYWVLWISIWFYWVEPIRNYIWKNDIFWRKLEMSRVNIVDSLSASAVLAMWEWAEQTPIVIIRDFNSIKFTNKRTYKDSLISLKEDIYYPLIKQFDNDK